MSYSTVLAITIGSGYEDLRELRNSHGSAPIIWNEMCVHLYGCKPYYYMFNGTLERLWPRWRDLSIPEHQRAVLMMTFDRAYVRKEHYARAAADIRKWLSDFPQDPKGANHWPEIASIYESDPGCEAIAIWQTSVSGNPFDGEWNEEAEDHGPLDWSTVCELYDAIDDLTGSRKR